jgi:hypothetical protein
MKICVLNGNPKGRDCMTLQYVRFLQLAFPGHTFVPLPAVPQPPPHYTATPYRKCAGSLPAGHTHEDHISSQWAKQGRGR